MVHGKVVTTLAVALAVAGAVPSAFAQDRTAGQIARAESKDQRQHLQSALGELQQARRQLALANRGLEGRRAQALEQTDYAIEQVFASLGDDAAKARDQQTAGREVQAGRDRWAKEKADIDRAGQSAGEQRKEQQRLEQETRKQLDTALQHLRRAKDRLGGASSEVHRDKALRFTNEAIADVERGLGQLK